MLLELNIRNFALIDSLALTFGPGFNVLSGETGAGKSIIVGAINLILGGRASADMIRQGQDEAEVQALFSSREASVLNSKLAELGLPENDETIIRRVITKTGRNRIYINGTLAALTQLSALGNELVAVSGQHEHQRLLDEDFQLLYLDQYGGLVPERERLSEVFDLFTDKKEEAARLKRKIKETREKAELFEFQSREIQDAGLSPGEDEELERERNLARNAEKIYLLVKESYDRLYGEAGAVVENLDSVRSSVEKASALDDRLSGSLEQINDAYHQLDDAAVFLRDHLEQITFDPARLEEVEDRLALITRLKRKYGPTLGDVMDFGLRAENHMNVLEDMQYELDKLLQQVRETEEQLKELALDLSEKRKYASEKMSVAITEELRSLGMPRLDFEISFLTSPNSEKAGPTGIDRIEFLVSPNVGEPLMPLARIASGGELSRAMLGLKSLLAGKDKMQTLVFDEVDSGIGGGVAEVVGRKLYELSTRHQLLCITHLPQIASFGANHFRVFKEVRGDRTVTDIRPLSKEDKVQEIARMLGGIEPSDKTKAAAEEMVASAGK